VWEPGRGHRARTAHRDRPVLTSIDRHRDRFPGPPPSKADRCPGRAWRSPSHEDGLRHRRLRVRVTRPGAPSRRLAPPPRSPRRARSADKGFPATVPGSQRRQRPRGHRAGTAAPIGRRGNRSPTARSPLRCVLMPPPPQRYNRPAPRSPQSVTTLRVIRTTATFPTSVLSARLGGSAPVPPTLPPMHWSLTCGPFWAKRLRSRGSPVAPVVRPRSFGSAEPPTRSSSPRLTGQLTVGSDQLDLGTEASDPGFSPKSLRRSGSVSEKEPSCRSPPRLKARSVMACDH
jgi:hypothetical protein